MEMFTADFINFNLLQTKQKFSTENHYHDKKEKKIEIENNNLKRRHYLIVLIFTSIIYLNSLFGDFAYDDRYVTVLMCVMYILS